MMTENYEEIEQLNAVTVGNKENLPKYTLPRGERLYLTREQITDLNDKYYQMLSDLKEGKNFVPEELQSVMESVIGKAYQEELDNLRLGNRLSMDTERARLLALIDILTPRSWRGWFFRRKRNQSQVLLDELVNREVAIYLQSKADELPAFSEDEEEGEQLPYEVLASTLVESLSKVRKKTRGELLAIVEELSRIYAKRVEDGKKLAAELEEVKQQLQQALERAINAEERLDEFMKESVPAPEEEEVQGANKEEEKEEKEEPEGAEPEQQEEEQKPADEEDDESLSYDGLDEE